MFCSAGRSPPRAGSTSAHCWEGCRVPPPSLLCCGPFTPTPSQSTGAGTAPHRSSLRRDERLPRRSRPSGQRAVLLRCGCAGNRSSAHPVQAQGEEGPHSQNCPSSAEAMPWDLPSAAYLGQAVSPGVPCCWGHVGSKGLHSFWSVSRQSDAKTHIPCVSVLRRAQQGT